MIYILNLKKKTKIIIVLIIIMLISAFLFIFLFSKDHKLLSTNSVIAYQCDYGWTKVGDGPSARCQKLKKDTYKCSKGELVGSAANPSCQECETTYYCDNGWRKVTGHGRPYCTRNETTYTCPKGFKQIGSGSSSYCRQVDYYTYSCPSGYTKVTGEGRPYCKKLYVYNYSCPKNTTKVGDGPTAYCLKQDGFTYSCPKNYIKKHDRGKPYCVLQVTGYYCPSGYTKAGDGPTAYCFKGKGNSRKTTSTIKRPRTLEIKSATEKKKYIQVSTIKTPSYLYSDSTATPHYTKVAAIPKFYVHTADSKTKKSCASPTKAYLQKKSEYSYTSIKAFSGSGTLSYSKNYEGKGVELQAYKDKTEPKPWTAIDIWNTAKGLIKKEDFVYPIDSTTGLLLGAWPKNYKNYPAQLNNPRTYGGGYMWPITIAEPYDDRKVYNHNGIDIAAYFGTPVYSPVSGTLVYSGWGDTSNTGSHETAYSITIRANNIVNYKGTQIGEVFLTHLSGIRYRCAESKCNISVKQGELLGFSGTAGDGYAPHLHMSLYPTNNYNAGLHTRDEKDEEGGIEGFYGIKRGDYREAGR